MNPEAFVPLAVPFILGLLSGVVIKKGVKLLFAGIALVIALIATGYVSMGFKDVKEKALEYLPKIVGEARDEFQVLPYSSGAFLVGIAIGFWLG